MNPTIKFQHLSIERVEISGTEGSLLTIDGEKSATTDESTLLSKIKDVLSTNGTKVAKSHKNGNNNGRTKVKIGGSPCRKRNAISCSGI